MNKKLKKLLSVGAVATLLLSNSAVNAFAYSDSASANLPNSSWKVQSNVWQSNTAFYQTHSFAVSAKLLNKSTNKAVNAERIKTTYSFGATGVGVSVKGVSSGSMSGSSFSGSWENKNAWISDMSGTFKLGGAPLWSSFNNSAFALKSGVKATSNASVFRFY